MNKDIENLNELEDMKSMWLNLNQRVASLEEENRNLARDVIRKKHKSSLDDLKTRYRVFIIIEILMLVWVPLFILNNPFSVEKYRLAAAYYWAIFFAGEVGIDYYLYLRVKSIDVLNQSISEVTKAASQTWKIHKLAIIIGFPVAIGAVILFGLVINANEFALYGMFLGFVAGILIGIRQLLKFKEDYRNLSTE